MILLGVSLLAALIVIGVGYFVGVESIEKEVYARLTSARNGKAFEVEEYFHQEAAVVEILAKSEKAAQAIQEFTMAFRQIEASDTISCTRDLEAYYDDFLDSLGQNLTVRRELSSYYPNSAAACYLQYHYLSKSTLTDARYEVDNAGDGSEYSTVHERYHDFYREALQKFGFYDIFLIDIQTKTIMYSVMKETDYATSLSSGPYRNSNLAALAEKVEKNADLNEAQIADFSFYRPSYGAPAAFMGSPVFYRNELVGILAVQLSVDKINRIMNYGGEWAENGLGETGEVLLVGEDYLLRSDPRSFLTDKDRFIENMKQINMNDEKIDLMASIGPILVTELRSDNITRALRGESNITEMIGYNNDAILSAFTPVDLPGGLRWALVTEIDEAEAMSPVQRFQNLNLAAVALIIAIITIMAMAITRSLIRPIDRLTEGAEAVRAGDTKVRVEKIANDEMGRLTEVFNGMVESIDEQKSEIEKQARENNDLLYNRFPDAIAERYRNGEVNIVDKFQGVTILSADLRGTSSLDEFTPDMAWPIVQEVSARFNDAADELGMEVIIAIPDGFLCVCGMNIPRLDNARRVAIMALKMREIIENINTKHNVSLVLNAGMSTGPVLAGILEDQTKNYVIWGPAVDAAQRLAYLAARNMTLGTEEMMRLMAGNFHFDKVHTIKLGPKNIIRVGRLVGRVTDLQAAGVEFTPLDLDAPTTKKS
ncbi:hypothetical protein A3850_014245 [Lewinella sp. 4G2]|nr:hypothetical protein A3850_014245 [Lewinella sp. 4G2]